MQPATSASTNTRTRPSFAARAIIREPYALALPERLDFAEGADGLRVTASFQELRDLFNSQLEQVFAAAENSIDDTLRAGNEALSESYGTDVEVEVELWVLDPMRISDLQRTLHDTAPEGWNPMDAL